MLENTVSLKILISTPKERTSSFWYKFINKAKNGIENVKV